jgi:hypothetical protein
MMCLYMRTILPDEAFAKAISPTAASFDVYQVARPCLPLA